MNIKSLLLGSAAALVAVSGAQAADAVVVAPEPEAVEYVRVCDVYGAGYFYIPGTENCLKLSGYYRYEIRYYAGTPGINDEGYTKFARFAPEFTVKSETEWGTLTGYARVFFDWTGAPGVTAYTTTTTLDHMYIEVAGVRIGKGDSPYSRFLGYGGPTINDGAYGFNNASELSYTWSGDGFSVIIAAMEDLDDTDYTPDVEGGVKFTQGWGFIGAMAGFDESDESWGAKVVASFALPNTPVSGSLHVFYSGTGGTAGVYTILDPAGVRTEWSAMLGLTVAFSKQLEWDNTVQYFDTDEWAIASGLDIRPFSNARLRIRPEVTYNTVANGTWGGRIRFQSDF